MYLHDLVFITTGDDSNTTQSRISPVQTQTSANVDPHASSMSSTQLGSSLNRSARPTVRSFVDWDKKREVAHQGKPCPSLSVCLSVCLFPSILLSSSYAI